MLPTDRDNYFITKLPLSLLLLPEVFLPGITRKGVPQASQRLSHSVTSHILTP